MYFLNFSFIHKSKLILQLYRLSLIHYKLFVRGLIDHLSVGLGKKLGKVATESVETGGVRPVTVS